MVYDERFYINIEHRINSASASFLSVQSNTGNVIPDLHHTKAEWNGIVWAKILTEWQFPLTTCKYWFKIKLLFPLHCARIFRRCFLCFVTLREHKAIQSWHEGFQSSESVWRCSSWLSSAQRKCPGWWSWRDPISSEGEMQWPKVPCTLASKRMRIKCVYACSGIWNPLAGRMNPSLCFFCRCVTILLEHSSLLLQRSLALCGDNPGETKSQGRAWHWRFCRNCTEGYKKGQEKPSSPGGDQRDSPKSLFRWSLDLPGLTFPKAKFPTQLISSLLAVLQETNPAEFGAQGISFLDGCSQIPRVTQVTSALVRAGDHQWGKPSPRSPESHHGHASLKPERNLESIQHPYLDHQSLTQLPALSWWRSPCWKEAQL